MCLKGVLDNKGVSVYRVSKDAGIPYSTLCDLVSGKTDINNANVRTLALLASYLGMTMDDLYNKLDSSPDFRLQKFPGLPTELDASVDDLINAFNNNYELIDCEISQVLGDINMSESWGLIDSIRAKELRKYYIFDVLDDIRRREAAVSG